MSLKISSISPNVVILGLVAIGTLLLVNKLTSDNDDDKPKNPTSNSPFPAYVNEQTKDASDLIFSPFWWAKKIKEAVTPSNTGGATGSW